MDLLIILTYVAFAWAMFKIFKIPVNKWTISTAALGGIFIVSGLILLMNYNHPYTFKAQKAVISIPVVPQVTGVVIEVTDKKNTLIKKGEVLFRLDPTRYQARVDRLMADIVTAEHKQRALGAELDEMAANTQQAKATRDKFAKEYQRYARGSQAKVNPFSERDIDVARQNYLAQEASVKSSAAEQKQIQSQLGALPLSRSLIFAFRRLFRPQLLRLSKLVANFTQHFIQHILDPPGQVFPFTEDSHQIQPPFIRVLKAGHQRAVLQIALHTFVWRKHNPQVISCQLQRRLRVIANVISLHAIIPHLFTPGDVEAPDIRVVDHHRVDQNTGVMFEFVRTANRMFLKIALAGISGYGILCNKTGNQRFIFWWSVAD